MKHQNVFWGTIMISLGLLFLFDRLGVINLEWYLVWKLWPFLLVLWGVSILPVKGLFKMILALAVAALSVFMYANLDPEESPFHHNFRFNFSEHDSIDREEIEQEFSQESDSVTTAKLTLEAGAGAFSLNGTTDLLVYVDKKGGNMVYDFKVEEIDHHADVSLKQKSDGVISGKTSNALNIELNEKPVWDFNIDIGAADFKFDLSPFKVNKVDLDGGATSIQLKLGDLHPDTEININAAASSIKIEIPASAGCSITGSSILSHREADGFNQIEKGRHETPGFESAKQKIRIKVDAAISGFEIQRY